MKNDCFNCLKMFNTEESTDDKIIIFCSNACELEFQEEMKEVEKIDGIQEEE